MPFKTLGLSDELVQGILATGFVAPTEIQSRAIPAALSGKDIIGSAQTGTGKTAAFVLPILQHLAKHHTKTHHCRALILTPTRELAQQIEDAISTYGRFLHTRTLAIYGGTNMQNQLKRLQRGVDIVIATPGRLLDHLERRSVDLRHVQILVIDEADRMFDMGFIKDVKKIVSHVPAERQTLMFSATMSKEVRDLMSALQKHPVLIEIGERRAPVDSVRQSFYSISPDRKMELLLFMLKQKELDSVLVFSRTKHGADKISKRLEKNGVRSTAIHSNRTQAQRMRALGGFRNGEFRVLVATDVAARGIDVEGISHVVNYDIPGFPEDYIHRIGRTGRASATGDAITFVAREDVDSLRRLERFTSKHFPLQHYPGFDYTKPAGPAVAPGAASANALMAETSTGQTRHPKTHSQHRQHHPRQQHQKKSGEGHHGRPQQKRRFRGHSESKRLEANASSQELRQQAEGKHTHSHPDKKSDWRKLIGEMAEKFTSKKRRKKKFRE
ncbi:MAG: DEAD/DEAH box helicase [Ignavibacteriae bacterium]|nr:DEAD/DEAH box helicase [Ignavibacteriota bacterium]